MSQAKLLLVISQFSAQLSSNWLSLAGSANLSQAVATLSAPKCSLLKHHVSSPSLTHPLARQCIMSTRPAQRVFPTTKLTANNTGELELATHHRAVASASVASTRPLPHSSSPLPESSPPPQTDTKDAANTSQLRGLLKQSSQALSTVSSLLSLDSIIILSPTTSDNPHEAGPTSKKTKTLLASGQELSHVLADNSIIEIDDINDP